MMSRLLLLMLLHLLLYTNSDDYLIKLANDPMLKLLLRFDYFLFHFPLQFDVTNGMFLIRVSCISSERSLVLKTNTKVLKFYRTPWNTSVLRSVSLTRMMLHDFLFVKVSMFCKQCAG